MSACFPLRYAALGASVRQSHVTHARRRSPRRRHRHDGRGARAVAAVGPAGGRDRGAGPPLLRAPTPHTQRSLGSLRAQRRRPVTAHRAQPLPCVPAGAGRGGQLAPASQRPGPPAAAVLVHCPGLQAVRPHEWAGRLPLALWGLARRPGHLRLRGAPLRPADRGLRGGRAVDDAALLRAGADDAGRRRARWRVWRWRSAGSRSRRSTATRRGPLAWSRAFPGSEWPRRGSSSASRAAAVCSASAFRSSGSASAGLPRGWPPVPRPDAVGDVVGAVALAGRGGRLDDGGPSHRCAG